MQSQRTESKSKSKSKSKKKYDSEKEDNAEDEKPAQLSVLKKQRKVDVNVKPEPKVGNIFIIIF